MRPKICQTLARAGRHTGTTYTVSSLEMSRRAFASNTKKDADEGKWSEEAEKHNHAPFLHLRIVDGYADHV